MTFTEDMDTTSLPPKPKFNIVVDNFDKTVTTLEWLNDRVLGAGFSEPEFFPSGAFFEYTTQTGKLRTALGALIEPFDLFGTRIDLVYAPFYPDPIFVTSVDFSIEMDRTIEPIASDFILTVDGVEKTITDIQWFAPGFLSMTFSEPGLTPTNARIRFITPTPRLRTAALQQACPFDLTAPVT